MDAICEMARIYLMASEEMLFENVDEDRWTDWRMPAYTITYKFTYEPLAQVS